MTQSEFIELIRRDTGISLTISQFKKTLYIFNNFEMSISKRISILSHNSTERERFYKALRNETTNN